MVDCGDCGSNGVIGDSYCRSCGVEMPDEDVITCDCEAIVGTDDNFCHDCGQAFGDKNVCGSCDAEFEEDADACPKCGVSLIEDDDSEGEDEESAPETPAPEASRPTV